VLRELLIQQLTHPVLWEDSMTTLRASDSSSILEVGPGKVLMGLMRRIDRGAKVHSLGNLETLEAWLNEAQGKEAGA
jgi:[acyl-carrier-protein] S-malonyltransferase